MLFSRLPDQFFQPLASPGRRHYAELLLIYYRLFLEYHTGVERELVVARFAEYFASIDAAGLEQDFTEEELAVDTEDAQESEVEVSSDGEAASRDPRWLASYYLRRLIAYGWIGEEEQLDFSRLITIKSQARPFFEALEATDRGAEVEYESHIVAVYSSLTGESARDNGEHAVLNAHYHTRLLIESLKVLDQNIRSHVQSLFDGGETIPEILHSHYDVYMHEVIDHAYTRLKTSDNLSRYRPRIAKAISAVLEDNDWLDRTAERLSLIRRTDKGTARDRVRTMLLEIRDDLKSIDPILESIDDRNRRYSRISTERIRAELHADSSLQGRIARVIAMLSECPPPDSPSLELAIHRLKHITWDSLYSYRSRDVSPAALERPIAPTEDEEIAAEELKQRVAGQLSPTRVSEFLGRSCTHPGDSVWGHELVTHIGDYVKLLYAAAYAERAAGFEYRIEWYDEQIFAGRFGMKRHRFIRRHAHD